MVTAVNIKVVQTSPLLSRVEAKSLIRPITKKEIDTALRNIDNSKAPGHDGWNSYFFKQVWSIIKVDLYLAIINFFEYMHMPRNINHMIISLIQKVPNADKVCLCRPFLIAQSFTKSWQKNWHIE